MIQQGKRNPVDFLLATVALVLLASAADAYVGPGAGLSLLTALWGIIAAVGVALFFVFMWPIRRFLRSRKQREASVHDSPPPNSSEPASAESDAILTELIATPARPHGNTHNASREQPMR